MIKTVVRLVGSRSACQTQNEERAFLGSPTSRPCRGFVGGIHHKADRTQHDVAAAKHVRHSPNDHENEIESKECRHRKKRCTTHCAEGSRRRGFATCAATTGRTFLARFFPSRFNSTSNETRWFTEGRPPRVGIAVMCTKISWPPCSGTMNPKARSSFQDLMVPSKRMKFFASWFCCLNISPRFALSLESVILECQPSLGKAIGGPLTARLCDAEDRTFHGRARSALRQHSHRGCPSVESEANAGSSAMRP